MSTDLLLRDFAPRPALTTSATHVEQPRFPVIDAHNHLGELIPNAGFAGPWPKRPVAELIEELDASGVRAVVNLDGNYGERLRYELDRYRGAYPDRFVVFAGLEYPAFEREADFGAYLARQLRDSAAAGAQGLKVWKPLGLTLRDPQGTLVPVNDPRLDELWATAGELKLPVLIHVADPVAFFQPLDRFNERWDELHAHPDWHFYGPQFPSFETIMEQFADVLTRHRNTTFIGAHVGCYAENLGWVGRMLEACPNFYVDIGARLGELGRQPYSTREFCIRYADRVLFGTDAPPDRAMYALHYRFLETRDEYFDYSLEAVPPQGRWQIYGIHLPDEVLQQIYFANAARILGVA
jgi:predicted TIM-barrel fold metal-dependent hydrolase